MLLLYWIVAASADVIASTNAFKLACQSTGNEYGLQLELLAISGPAEVPIHLATMPHGFTELLDSAFDTPATLGPYSIGDRDEAMNLIVRDLLDASAVTTDWPSLEIDWASVGG
jgi:hypothetical protein